MTRTTRLAASFLALATAAAAVPAAYAQDGNRDGRKGQRFERTDADRSGDISFEEFAAAMGTRFAGADSDGDGKMTVGEIATEIQRQRAERMARRIVQRFDTDGDGALTAEEVESRQRKMFALMDRNDDGKITRQEMPRGKGMRGRMHRGGAGRL